MRLCVRARVSIDKEQLWTRTACDGGFRLAYGSSAFGPDAPCVAAEAWRRRWA